MKIGFISDTHGDYEKFLLSMEILNVCDYIIHTGDVLDYGVNELSFFTIDLKNMNNIFFVRGNNDFFDYSIIGKPLAKYEDIFEFDDGKDSVKILATHSHKSPINIMHQMAISKGCKILAYGHTHVKKLENNGGIIIINPGSPSRPRDSYASVGMLDTVENKISLIDIRNLKILKEIKFKE